MNAPAEVRTLAQDVKVFLIGGTSHVGKSTLARRAAASLGWRHLSTDQFARHPGRPWRDDRSRLPADVVAHYSLESVTGLLDSVVQHYRRNVWPIAEAVIRSNLNNPFDPFLVLEGSAILPEMVSSVRLDRCGRVWLTATDQLIAERIMENSQFGRRTDDEKKLIEAFIQRALAFNEMLVDSAGRLGERCLDVGSPDVFDELLSHVKAG